MKDKYGESNSFGDHDLEKEYQGREIALNLLYIANELAEVNRLKKLELTGHFTEKELEGKD